MQDVVRLVALLIALLALPACSETPLYLVGPGADTDADTDTDTDADTDTGTDTGDAGTDTDTDTEPEFAPLYDRDSLPTFELTIPPACVDALALAPFEYCAGDLTYRPTDDPADAVFFANVGIHLKGRASFQTLDGKAGFKIKLDEYVAGQRLYGLRRITLNNMVQDPSMTHERIGYLVFRAAGVPAPLANNARVYVNGAYYGLYLNVQSEDDEFVEHLYDPAPGNLYDISNDVYFVDFLPEWKPYFVLETNTTAPDTADLDAAIAAANGPDGSFFEDAGLAFDWGELLAVGAAQALIADWDGYFGARNNYKAYHELGRDRFILFPWGIDQTFGVTDGHPEDPLWHLGYALDGSTSERENGWLFLRCKAAPACLDLYLSAVAAALAAWDALPLEAELDFILAQTAAAKLEDARKPYTDEQTAQYADAMRTFLQQRGDVVADQLAAAGY
jgi:predicted small lipoprotein YifL